MLWTHDRNEAESSPTANNLRKMAQLPEKLHIYPKTMTQTQMLNQCIDTLVLHSH